MNTTTPATKTPGYNCRLQIALTADRHGKPIAYYWSRSLGGMGRWIRMGRDAAEQFIGQEQADQVPYTGSRATQIARA